MANDAAIPSAHFFVESALVEFLADELHTGRVVIYEESRKTGKTTDSLAVCRRLRKRGIQVQCMVACPHACCYALVQPSANGGEYTTLSFVVCKTICFSHGSKLLMHSLPELQGVLVLLKPTRCCLMLAACTGGVLGPGSGGEQNCAQPRA